VFGLCHLLGFRFAPRLRDLSERRPYIVDRRADYGALNCLIGGAINLRKIEENWDEILRMTASIRAGTVAPSVLMRRHIVEVLHQSMSARLTVATRHTRRWPSGKTNPSFLHFLVGQEPDKRFIMEIDYIDSVAKWVAENAAKAWNELYPILLCDFLSNFR